MGARQHLFSGILALLSLAACAHEPPSRIEVPYQYPQAGERCDNQRPIAPGESQLLVPHIRESHPPHPEGDKVQNWTAALAMITTYLGKPMAPCQVASVRVGGLSCCRPASALSQESCQKAAWPNEIELTLKDMELHAVHLTRPLSEREIKQEISNGRPVLVVRGTQALVITGYAGATYHLLDPGPEGGTIFLSHDALAKGWRESWYLIAFRRDACVPRFHGDCDCLH